MSLQSTVQRGYVLGFAGQIVRDGPKRAKIARIVSATLGTDPGASTNRISRAFGYSQEVPELGTSPVQQEAEVIVGGANFFGVLGQPQRYALYGKSGDALAASYDLPQGVEGEFFDMVTGMIMEVFNFTTGAETPTYGDPVGYVPSTITTANNPLALPYGALVTWAAGAAVPTGIVQIPTAKIVVPMSLAASAAGALVSGNTIVQI
jgi:hypothetical protein